LYPAGVVSGAMSDDQDSREQGIDFGDLDETLADLDYPIENEDLLEDHGDAEIQHPNGTEPLSDVLAEAEGQTYETEEELREMVFNMVGEEAVGREGYSDRGGSAESEGIQDDQESF
jgi:hypothetical protein